ncbi:hypothetical protein B0H11DRAFT_1931505 [Mycena galericulata]|nr:hypothetical protein B0H11DRAFT_1931505 [Mycena galericulata]
MDPTHRSFLHFSGTVYLDVGPGGAPIGWARECVSEIRTGQATAQCAPDQEEIPYGRRLSRASSKTTALKREAENSSVSMHGRFEGGQNARSIKGIGVGGELRSLEFRERIAGRYGCEAMERGPRLFFREDEAAAEWARRGREDLYAFLQWRDVSGGNIELGGFKGGEEEEKNAESGESWARERCTQNRVRAGETASSKLRGSVTEPIFSVVGVGVMLPRFLFLPSSVRGYPLATGTLESSNGPKPLDDRRLLKDALLEHEHSQHGRVVMILKPRARAHPDAFLAVDSHGGNFESGGCE